MFKEIQSVTKLHRTMNEAEGAAAAKKKRKQCSQRVSIPRPLVYKTNALPLSYGSSKDATLVISMRYDPLRTILNALHPI